MFEEVLRELGLSLNESRVYEAMIALGEANVAKISVKSGVHRRNVYDSLNKLIEKGLVSQSVKDGEKQFRANKPERLKAILKDKQDKLEQALPNMKKQYQKLAQKEQAYIYRGVQGFRNYMQDILDVGEDVYCVGAKGGWWDPRLQTFRKRFYKQFREQELNAWHLFDFEMRDVENESPVPEHINQARFLPEKYSTNSAIDIFGDRVVTFTGLSVNSLADDLVQFVIISQELADSYKKWFWLMWDACE